MKYHSISDEIWKDVKFKRLSSNAKLAFMFLLTTPDFNFAGVHYCPSDQMAVYTRISEKACKDALSELHREGMVRVCGDYVVLHNYLKHNSFGCTHYKKLIKDIESLPEDVFAEAMQVITIKIKYIEACNHEKINKQPLTIFDDENAINHDPDQASDQEPKPKKEPKTRQTKGNSAKVSFTAENEPREISELRGYVANIIAEYPDCKWGYCDITTEQYAKLICKWGRDKLVGMQKMFYEWKCTTPNKPSIKCDFNVLNKDTCWVSRDYDKYYGNTDSTKSTKSRDSLMTNGEFL